MVPAPARMWLAVLVGGSGSSGRALLCTGEEGLRLGSRLGSITWKMGCISWAGAFQPGLGLRPEGRCGPGHRRLDLCSQLGERL